MRLKPVAVWTWEKTGPLRLIDKHLFLKGYATDAVYNQLLAALEKGQPDPPPKPEKWALTVDVSVDYKRVTAVYIAYFYKQSDADQFWTDWRAVEQNLGKGSDVLTCTGTSHENGGGGC